MIGKVIQQAGMNQILENAERLNRYMNSIDQDLKNMQNAMNDNFRLYASALEQVEKGLSELKEKLNYGKVYEDTSKIPFLQKDTEELQSK